VITRSVLVLTWLGTGVAFCSTLMEAAKALTLDAASWGASSASPADASVTLAVLITSVAGTTGAAFRLVEHVARTSVDFNDQSTVPCSSRGPTEDGGSHGRGPPGIRTGHEGLDVGARTPVQ
jgi:hypothetical protein